MRKEDENIFEKAKIEVRKAPSSEQIKREIKENYKIGIEFYEDVEKRQDRK